MIAPKPGEILDNRYRIIRSLATGGFGQTYIAEDTRRPGHPECVVKHLTPATNDPEFLKNATRLFQTEAQTLEKLGEHEQIPRLLAYFEENQEFYLVQDRIEGHPLSKEFQTGQRWSEIKTIQMLQEILKILEFVHSYGVIHRDIKPDNIIRRHRDNKLVLVDFGTVKQIQTKMLTIGEVNINQTIVVGTPGYMPTEQSRGNPRPNSDIYALGVIAIRAVTGMNPSQLQEDPQTGEIIWQPWAQIGRELIEIIAKMVRYHFKERYQSVSEVLEDLEPIIHRYERENNSHYTNYSGQNLPTLPNYSQSISPTFSQPIEPSLTAPPSQNLSPVTGVSPSAWESTIPQSAGYYGQQIPSLPPASISGELPKVTVITPGNNKYRWLIWGGIIGSTVLVAIAGTLGVMHWLNQPALNGNPNVKTTNTISANPNFLVAAEKEFSQIPSVPAGQFNHGGSSTWVPIRQQLNLVIPKLLPNFRLRYTQPVDGKPNSQKGIAMLIDNQLAFSESSRSVKPEEHQQAQQKGFTLKEVAVAIDGIAIAVNKNLNISGLTVSQLKDIYTGKITNWRRVGGPNLTIIPLSRQNGGTSDFFQENVLDKQPFARNVKNVGNTTQAIQLLKQIPGGIFYASAPEIVEQCAIKSVPIGRDKNNFIPPYQEPLVSVSQCLTGRRNQLNITAFRNGNYPITRNLFVIVKQNNQIEQQAGETYANILLTSKGQELIQSAGFVPIR